MPFFSVIIPLYNKELFIENTLRSVLAQTFTDFEVIIVNDGSTDQSVEKVSSFDDKRIRLISKDNEGVSIARNHGLSLANADYITFLDADDYWYPGFLETMKSNIIDFPDQKVFSAAYEIETSKKVFPAAYSIDYKPGNQIVNYFDASHKESIIWTSCVVFHKDVFDKCGPFDTSMKNSEDIDMWIRIGMAFDVVFCRKILARYTHDSQSLSRNNNLKVDFSKYADLEKANIRLKKFIDMNRFSLAVKSKIKGDKKTYHDFRSNIDFRSLSLKKTILINLPGFVLKMLVRFREKLADMGLSNSVFK